MKLYRLRLTRTLANGVTGERTVGYFRTEADCENAIPEAKINFNIREDCDKFSIQERDFETSGDESLVTEVCEGRYSVGTKVLADVLFESMDELMNYVIKIAEETDENEKGSLEFAAATFKINEVSKPDDFPGTVFDSDGAPLAVDSSEK
ncbi:MAG TPA: hypothetical protein DCY17_00355 [Clostridiales bacterium]|nr:hypothetical protein [Clostridiales bacterium]